LKSANTTVGHGKWVFYQRACSTTVFMDHSKNKKVAAYPISLEVAVLQTAMGDLHPAGRPGFTQH
jgi:hypothetical protein